MPIEVEKDGGIVTITINRPERRNALDLPHFGALANA
jgi:enoyl-CoA hydratase/carnithine racemase